MTLLIIPIVADVILLNLAIAYRLSKDNALVKLFTLFDLLI